MANASLKRFKSVTKELLEEVSLSHELCCYSCANQHSAISCRLGLYGSCAQVQARSRPKEDDPTIAGHLLRLRDTVGRPLSQERLHAEFSVMFIGGADLMHSPC